MKRDYNNVFKATVNGEKVFLKARKPGGEKQIANELLQMKFIEYTGKHVSCATYVGPGVVTTKTMQVVVMKAALGRHPTYEDCLDRETVLGIGKWLADFH